MGHRPRVLGSLSLSLSLSHPLTRNRTCGRRSCIPSQSQSKTSVSSFFFFLCVCSSLVLPTHSDRNLIELIALTFFSTLLSRDHIKEQQQQSTTTTAKKKHNN